MVSGHPARQVTKNLLLQKIETEKIVCRNWSFISRKGELLLRAKKRKKIAQDGLACIAGWEDLLTLFSFFFIFLFFGGLECVGRSFVYVVHFKFLRDVWITTQRAAVTTYFLSGNIKHKTDLAEARMRSSRVVRAGGYKEMSSTFADQQRPHISSPNARGEWDCGVSANECSCAHHVTWSPNKLWRSTSIFNLWVRASDCKCRSPGFDLSILRHSGI